MDKEDVAHKYNRILLSYKRKKIMPFAATRIDLEIVILSEIVRYRKTNIIYCLYMESKKGSTEELTYKTEIASQM